MNPRTLFSCAAALAFAVTARAQSPDKRPDQPSPPPPPSDSRAPSPMMRRDHGGSPEGRDGDRRDNSPSDPRARLAHLMEAIQHLRAAGLNEPAGDLEKMARELREHIERERRDDSSGKSRERAESFMREHKDGERHDGERRDGKGPDSGRPSFARPPWGGGPPMMFGRMEEMQKEIRTLSSQVQELRNMMKGRGGDQQPSARKPDGPRDGDRRDGNAGGPPRRPDGPPRPEQEARDGEGRRDGDRDGASRNNPSGELRSQGPRDDAKRDGPPRDDAKRDGAPRDGGARNGPPHDGPPRGDAQKRDGAPHDEAKKEGAHAESSSGVNRPSEQERARFTSLSDRAKQKFIERMRESRDKMMNSTPEERMKFAKDLFDRVEAEDKVQDGESSSADDALRALDVKPPF